MTRHKGNRKSLEPYILKSNREKPLNIQLGFKIDEDMNNRLSAIPDKAEFCRNAILKALDQLDIDKDIDKNIDKDKD